MRTVLPGSDLSAHGARLNFQPRLTGDKEAADDTVSSWTLAPVTLDYVGTVDSAPVNKSETLDFSDVYAPIEFSYHCTNRSWALAVQPNKTSAVSFSALELPGFQVGGGGRALLSVMCAAGCSWRPPHL